MKPAQALLCTSIRLLCSIATCSAIAVAAMAEPPPVAEAAPAAEGTSLLGTPLYAVPAGKDPDAETYLANARTILSMRPDHPDAHLWLGRRLGYLWRMNEAAAAFGVGIEKFPDDPRFYRHRGHRLISLRRFEKAERDLERAAELIARAPELGTKVEPDGRPNASGVPLTTTGFNTFYHLALARYLRGDYEGALEAWEGAKGHARELPDNLAAVGYWTYLTLRKLGKDEEARALVEGMPREPELLENHTYHKLLMLFKGGDEAVAEAERALPEGDLDFATMTAGIGHYHMIGGREKEARAAYEKVMARGNWPAFGHIAAEVELARMGKRGDEGGGGKDVA